MISQHSTATLGSLEQGPRRWRRIAGGVILAVAVVGTVGIIGVWQVRERSTPSMANREAAAPAAAVTNGSAGASSASGPAPSMLYLVDSPEEAAFLRQALAELTGLRRALGQPPVEQMVVEASALDAGIGESLPRPPGTTVFDLRVR
jgi:hypothetical protein